MENRYIGLRFGKLTVIEIADDKTYKVRDKIRRLKRYKCKCDCGNETIVFGQDLRSGKTTSCHMGLCLLRASDTSEVAFNILYNHYGRKNKNQKHGNTFSIDRESFKILTQQDCFYCGAKPNNIIKSKMKLYTSEYIYNGLDRVDNTKGYTIDNVVSCCKQCNVAKNNMPQQEFFDLVSRIAKKHNL